MKPRVAWFLALPFLLATGWWISTDRLSQGGAKTGDAELEPASRVAPTPDLKATKAKDRFRDWAADRTLTFPAFRTVQSVARSIATEDLVPLIDEFDGSMHDGIEGWLRASLWAELGRRSPEVGSQLLRSRFPLEAAPVDPNRPFADIEGSPEEVADYQARHEEFQRSEKEANLAAFAYFRGRLEASDFSPDSLEPLIRDFAETARTISNEGWSSRVDETLFRMLSRENPELAWSLLPGPARESPLARHRQFFTYASFDGFFGGLSTKKEAELYASRWQAFWESPEVKANYSKEGYLSEQWHYRAFGIAQTIASALARFDHDAAVRWAEQCPYFEPDEVAPAGPAPFVPEAKALHPFPEAHRSFVPPTDHLSDP